MKEWFCESKLIKNQIRLGTFNVNSIKRLILAYSNYSVFLLTKWIFFLLRIFKMIFFDNKTSLMLKQEVIIRVWESNWQVVNVARLIKLSSIKCRKCDNWTQSSRFQNLAKSFLWHVDFIWYFYSYYCFWET